MLKRSMRWFSNIKFDGTMSHAEILCFSAFEAQLSSSRVHSGELNGPIQIIRIARIRASYPARPPPILGSSHIVHTLIQSYPPGQSPIDPCFNRMTKVACALTQRSTGLGQDLISVGVKEAARY